MYLLLQHCTNHMQLYYLSIYLNLHFLSMGFFSSLTKLRPQSIPYSWLPNSPLKGYHLALTDGLKLDPLVCTPDFKRRIAAVDVIAEFFQRWFRVSCSKLGSILNFFSHVNINFLKINQITVQEMF